MHDSGIELKSGFCALCTNTTDSKTAHDLIGLWEAKLRFGPDIHGTLYIKHNNGGWSAEIAARAIQAKMAGDSVSFDLPNGNGSFRGKFSAHRAGISGFWIQPSTPDGGSYASPVMLKKFAGEEWRGNVLPLDGTMTHYLCVKERIDGSVGAFITNPERNVGYTQYRVDHLERDGESVKLLAADKGTEKGNMLAEGRYDAQREVLSVYFPNRGGTFDFRRVPADDASDFYPRGRKAAPYVYTRPPLLDDGWPTASQEEVGISRTDMEKFIRKIIDTPIDSARSQEDHGILIARHGKLVLEEYFHGENREKPHDTRSASKSVASDLAGAAMYAGTSVNPSSYVYKIMNGGQFPSGLDPRKRMLTLEHLLTMSSGFDCDEGDEKSAGYEDNVWNQTEQPDFYKWTMDLTMVRDPGDKSVYCSANANLTGGVVARAAKQTTLSLFQNLIAGPLQIKRYYLPVTPGGDYYMGGGAKFLPRDFMKLGQVHLNNGTWNGRRVYTAEWSRRATSHQADIGTQQYGYLWWLKEYPYKGHTVRAYYAAGNGGQIVMAIPELDLVLAFYAGNYNDTGGRTAQNVYVPEYILPAVDKDR